MITRYYKSNFQMESKIFLICLLFILLLPLQAQDNETKQNKKLEIPTNKVGTTIKGINYKVDQGRSFQLIHLLTLQKKFLFLSLASDQVYSHIELSLTIFKQGTQTPLKRCIKQDIDACYISRQQLQQNETLLIVVESNGQQCQYELRSYWSDLEHIQIGKQIKFMFSKTQQKQVYHLQLDGKEFTQLRIIIKPQTRRFAFDKIKMYGTFGKNSQPSSQHHDFKSHYLWEDAEGIYLNKKQLKDLSINLILQGSIQTVYTMSCNLVKSAHNDIALNNKIYEYLQKDEQYDYHIQFKNSQGNLTDDVYVFTLAIFTGDLNLQYYTDKQKTKRLTSKEPFMYMGDMQYVLRKQQIQAEMPNGLYMKALSKNRVSTFMMELEGRSKSKVFQLHQHVYQFMQVKNSSVSYFKVAKFQEANKKGVSLKVIVTLIQVFGKVGIELRKCTSTKQNCTGELFAAHSTKIQSEYRSVGSKNTYSLTLEQSFWKSVNIVQQNAIIIVVLTNQEQGTDSFAALEYNIGNRPEFLRENKPIESHVLKNELKVYKFVNNDNTIQKLRLHINKINGCFNTYVFRHQPSQEELKSDANKVSGSIYEITDKLNEQPLIIIIRGQDSATYSLVVQPVHKDELQIDYITLSEDVQFKLKIKPNQYQILQIVPILNNIFYKYVSTGALHACVLKDNVCQDKQANFTNQGELTFANFETRALYVKLRNPSSTKSIQVRSIFHSSKQEHCQLKKVGYLYQQVVKQGSCYITHIDSAQDFQVLIVRQEVGELSYTMALCDKLLNFATKQNGQERYLISGEQIKTNCLGHSELSFVFAVAGKKSKQEGTQGSIHLKYLVELTSSKVILPDGIGYRGSEVTKQQAVKKFVYPLLNKGETSIILSTQKRLYFLAKVIQSSQRDTAQLSLSSFDFTSPSQKFFYLQSIYLKISEQELSKFPCKECELLIFVYSKEEIGSIVDYTIQVTQNFAILSQGVPKSGYLAAQSKAYYGYKVKQAGSLLVEVSDNNRDCTELYLSSMEYPDQKKHLEKSYDGQIVVDVSTNVKNYYITVKSRKNCAYTITAVLNQGKNHIVKLQRGALGYCTLMQNQVKLYTFKHLSQKPFKIVSLHKYGQVDFYLNRTTPQDMLNLMKKQTEIDPTTFSFHSDFKNRLILSKQNEQFCKGCSYILAVKAKKHTQSSIFLGDQETKIPLSQQKVLNDILSKKNMVTRGQFYYFEKGVLEVKVHSGKLQVQIVYKGESHKTVFEKNNEIVLQNFTLSNQKGYYDSVTAIYTALQDNTIYSSRIKPASTKQNNIDGKSQITIDPNQPSFLYLSKGQPSCLTGYLKRADQRLFISFYSQVKQEIKSLKIVGKLNGNSTRVSQDTTRNVISITFIDAANQILASALPYELCLTHDSSSMALTAMQSEQTSLLPENLQAMVVSKQTYDIYPEGDFILDIFECRGSAKISYGSSKKKMQESKPKILDMIGMPDQPHAVRLQQGYSNLLLQVQAELSLIRWISIDEEEERGLGYYVYKAGKVKYNSAFGQIQFLVDPVKRIKKTKTKLLKIRYNLYVSNSEEDLKYASLCEKYLPGSVIQYKVIYSALSQNLFKFKIQKSTLTQKYKQADNLFFNIVADLTIKTPDETEEQYRFIYQSQQLPAQVFTPNQLQVYDFTTLIVALVLFIAAIITFSWIFVKVCVPMIGRLRNRMLVEQNGQQNSKQKKEQDNEQKIEAPPSSDRQGIHFTDNVQTEQKM